MDNDKKDFGFNYFEKQLVCRKLKIIRYFSGYYTLYDNIRKLNKKVYKKKNKTNT